MDGKANLYYIFQMTGLLGFLCRKVRCGHDGVQLIIQVSKNSSLTSKAFGQWTINLIIPQQLNSTTYVSCTDGICELDNSPRGTREFAFKITGYYQRTLMDGLLLYTNYMK